MAAKVTRCETEQNIQIEQIIRSEKKNIVNRFIYNLWNAKPKALQKKWQISWKQIDKCFNNKFKWIISSKIRVGAKKIVWKIKAF